MKDKALLEKIIDERKKQKRLKKQMKERYWKLSPIERIDFDNKYDKINSHYRISIVSGIFEWFKLIIIIPIFLFLMGFFIGQTELFYNISQKLLISFLNVTPTVMGFLFFLAILFAYSKNKKINQLEKRFKIRR